MDIGSFVLILVVLGVGLFVVFQKYGARSATRGMAAGAHAGHQVAPDAEPGRWLTPGAGPGVDPHAEHDQTEEPADRAQGGHGCC
jgi:hypothetical protein